MKPRNIVIVAVLVVMLGGLAIAYLGRVSGYAPMVAMPVKITRGGQAIAAGEVVSVQYAFSERTTSEAQQTPPSPWQEAKVLQDEFYLVDAPFTVMNRWGPFGASISPLYRSLTLRITLKHGGTATVIYPVLSDTKLNQAIYVDMPGEAR